MSLSLDNDSVVVDMPRPWAMKSPNCREAVGAVDCSATWLDQLNVEGVDEEESSRPRTVPLANEAFLRGIS